MNAPPGRPARFSPGSPRPDSRLRSLAAPLTSRGWGLVAMAVAATVAADVLGIEELYPIAVAAVVLVAYAVMWSWTRRWRIDVGRRLQPGPIEAGGAAVVIVTLHNRSATSTPVLTLRDPVDGGRRTITMAVAPLAARQKISGSYRLPLTGRGVFTLGPIALEASDPLGLARRARASSVVATYVVHPRVDRLRPPHVAAGSDRNRGATLPLSGQGNDEFASLREYQLGDDLRRMHWVSTARTDTLMVRENQLERRGEFTVVLDSRAGSWSAATFERAVSAAASICSTGLDAGLHTRLLTTGGLDSGAGAGRPQRARLLELLAEIAPDQPLAARRGGAPASPHGPAAVHRPSGGTVVVVTSDSGDVDELQRRGGVSHRSDVILVVIDRSSSPATSGPAPARGSRQAASAGRVVRVGPDTALAAAWDSVS